ncbi:MAG: hypothetical protein EBS97_00935 [Verrucomicrobia bacterium]|nr:hypothetical protein [Microbacteriaceae bacterium]NBS06540.1 hypothetical protein [Verrucomicrobiota bacterium]NBS49175.1 hypothetical protein [Verrucomicrobiota bacterium]NBS78573.1 hypothetical protein [bacterium]
MSTPLAILLGGLAFVGTVEARLGETRDEIEKKVGKLEEADFRYPQIRLLRLSNKEGFSQIDYLFFKQDNPQTAKCVGVIYFKIYEDKRDKITIREA